MYILLACLTFKQAIGDCYVGDSSHSPELCIAKTLLMFEINGLRCEPYVAEGIAPACYS